VVVDIPSGAVDGVPHQQQQGVADRTHAVQVAWEETISSAMRKW
jgi:hypothetical protein